MENCTHPTPKLTPPSAPTMDCWEPPRLPDCGQVRERPSSLTRAVPGAVLAVTVRAVMTPGPSIPASARGSGSQRAGIPYRHSPGRALNSAALDFVSPVAMGRGWGDLEGLLGSAFGALEAENPCFGIIARIFTGWVRCHSNRHKNHPPDLSCWLLRVQHHGAWETLSPMCPQPRLGSFLTCYP